MAQQKARFQPIRVNPRNLLFDANNPRFQGEFPDFAFVPYELIGEKKEQDRARNRLNSRFSIKQLAESIALVGFLPVDNIVVTAYRGKKYLVIEGNRRLAAVKMILDGGLKYSAGNIKELRQIRVLLHGGSYEDASTSQWLIQGTRHVGGIKSWGPYQKARALQILQREAGYTSSQAASVLGLTPQEAKRSLTALGGFQALQEHPVFGPKSRPEHFSFMDEMRWKPALRERFGWDNKKMVFVDDTKRDFFFRLIMGDPQTGKPPKIKSALLLRELPKILANEAATASLEDFDEPFDKAVYLASLPSSATTVSEIVARLQSGAQELAQTRPSDLSSSEKRILAEIARLIDSLIRQG